VRFLCLAALLLAAPGSRGAAATLVELARIWDAAPHNAFTDLARFQGRWYCVFREGQAHVSPDGALRVIVSEDGRAWSSAVRLTSADADLRDPKITVTPEGSLMLTGAAARHPPAAAKHQTLAWFSRDGRTWSEPVNLGEADFWLWRVTWHRQRAYGVGYHTAGENFVRLYASLDGRRFEALVPRLFDAGRPNEHALVFLPDDTCLCLLRRDGQPESAQLGSARPPYTHWTWKDLAVRVGGPNGIRLPDGRVVAAARRYDGGVRTSLMWLDADPGRLVEFLRLPSDGDTGYPGLVWHEGLLWVSYYSSHEGKASIYLAKVRLEP
jgi:hypothetical protein